jgi:hypothetical protein
MDAKRKENQTIGATQTCSFRKLTGLTRIGYQRNFDIRGILKVVNTHGDSQGTPINSESNWNEGKETASYIWHSFTVQTG